MAKSELAGKVQTVLGVIESRDLGITLPHEHLLIDGRVSFIEPDGASDRALAHKPVSLEILSWLRYHPFENQDNAVYWMNKMLLMRPCSTNKLEAAQL